LRQLFYMKYMITKSDSTETYTELIYDISEVDQTQLRDYLQSNKLEKNWEADKRLVHIKYICHIIRIDGSCMIIYSQF
jgi:hypothetical protein